MADCLKFHQQMDLKPLSAYLNIEYCDAAKTAAFAFK